MSSKDDRLIVMTWQSAIEVNGNLVTLIKVNLKTVVLKLLGHLPDGSFVWLKAVKLVNDGCLEGIC